MKFSSGTSQSSSINSEVLDPLISNCFIFSEVEKQEKDFSMINAEISLEPFLYLILA